MCLYVLEFVFTFCKLKRIILINIFLSSFNELLMNDQHLIYLIEIPVQFSFRRYSWSSILKSDLFLNFQSSLLQGLGWNKEISAEVLWTRLSKGWWGSWAVQYERSDSKESVSQENIHLCQQCEGGQCWSLYFHL